MNLNDLHKESTPLQTKKIFSPAEGVISIQLKSGGQLKEHSSKVPAFLVCVTGEVIFENEKGISVKLLSGDFLNIEPDVKHWIKGISNSQLLLIK
jgi:quercetin dioxygenase-like cupin family protein